MKLTDVRGLMAPEEVQFLATLAARVPGWASIIELGTHTGLSTCWLGDGSRRGKRAHVTAIDPFPEPRPDSRDDPYELGPDGVMAEFHGNLTALGLWPYVTPLRSTSLDVARTWVAPIGLLFDDAAHDRATVLADYGAWSQFVTMGGVIAFHDYDATDYPGVIEAVEGTILPSGRWGDVRRVGSLWTAMRIA